MSSTSDFAARLSDYKQAIDADIAQYAAHVRAVTRHEYGEYSAAVTEAYLRLLEGDGKRIRGALVMVGYEMLGGQDRTMILRAATALELVHAALLAIDDIQDEDDYRRGQPAVHKQLRDYHEKLQLKGDSGYVGISLGINAALGGLFAAQTLLAGLSVPDELRVKAVGIVSHTIITTLHGQTNDIVNAHKAKPDQAVQFKIMEWKSANYTFLNPLCVGMVLAGAGCEDTDAIRDYALHTGIAFQLVDDILDGDRPESDVAEKRRQAVAHTQQALDALEDANRPWDEVGVAFLRDLAKGLLGRAA